MQVPAWVMCFVVVASLFSLSYAQVNWSTLTSDQLSQLQPSAFSNLTADQLSAIPSSSCTGFQPGQIAVFPASAFAGWKALCVSLLPDTAWNQTTAAQISQLAANASYGLTSLVVYNMPPSAAAGWTATSLHGLSMDEDHDGCNGFTSPQFAEIPLEAYPGWTAVCIISLVPDIFANMSATEFNTFSLDVYEGFNFDQIILLQDDVLLSIPLSNFRNFTKYGMVSAHQLAILVQKYGKNITDLFTNDQFEDYDGSGRYGNCINCLQFKAMIPNPLAPLYQTLPQNTTWLQLALTENVSIDSHVFQSNGFTRETVWGITAAQAPSVSSDVLQTIMSCCAVNILSDTINAFSCYQLSFLDDNAYKLNYQSITAYNSKSAECPVNSTTSTSTSPLTSSSGLSISSGSSSQTTSTSSGHMLGISQIEFGAIAIAGVFVIFGI